MLLNILIAIGVIDVIVIVICLRAANKANHRILVARDRLRSAKAHSQHPPRRPPTDLRVEDRLAKLRANQRLRADEADRLFAEHMRHREQLRQHTAQPSPTHNPGPGLRPHPVYTDPAFVILPAATPKTPHISTTDSPDGIDITSIHTMTMPIGASEQIGESAYGTDLIMKGEVRK